jgi:hypothetical protein
VNVKRKTKEKTYCCDTLLEIAGIKMLGVPINRCLLQPEQEVVVIDGPIEVKNSDGILIEIIKTRHLNEQGQLHEGWASSSAFA